MRMFSQRIIDIINLKGCILPWFLVFFKKMRKFIFFCLFIIGPFFYSWSQSFENVEFHLPFGVKLFFAESESTFLEKNSREEVKTTPLETIEIYRTIFVLTGAIIKYPEVIIRENLKEIYVFKSLEIDGLSYGGTYRNSTVFLTNAGEDRHYSDQYIERTFHAEFSSILFNSFEECFPFIAWIKANTIPYGEGGKEALRSGLSSADINDSNFHSNGLLNQYAGSSLENDLNSIAKYLFIGDPRLWAIGKNNVLIQRKIDLAIKFYACINEQFSKSYFQKI